MGVKRLRVHVLVNDWVECAFMDLWGDLISIDP